MIERKQRNVGVGQGVGGGRPLKFKSVSELQKAIVAWELSHYDYMRDMWGNRWIDKEAGKDEDGNPRYVMKKVKAFTVTGLALALGTTRDTLMDYESGRYDDYDEAGNQIDLSSEQLAANEQIDKFSDTIRRAKLLCYEDTEQYLYRPGTAHGAAFSLKNNYGWEDKTTTVTELPRKNTYEDIPEAELRRLAALGEEPTS